MKVVITGGMGFVGRQLARSLLKQSKLTGPDGKTCEIDEMILFDLETLYERPKEFSEIVRIECGEVSDAAAVRRIIDRPDISIFHLASVVSGGGEKDFDLALRVNLQGTLNVLEAARALGTVPRVVFTSSLAVFGGKSMPKTVGDTTKQTPQTTYGMTKAIGELLVNDYTRKRYVDGRSARLPTVIIRPGKPNKAASSFASGVFREPLNQVECLLPVNTDTVMPLAGYRTIVSGLIRLHELDGVELGEDRAVNFPSLAVSVTDMIESLKRVAGGRKLGAIRVESDPFIEQIVATWPTASDYERARKLGLPVDANLDAVVQAYIEDFLLA